MRKTTEIERLERRIKLLERRIDRGFDEIKAVQRAHPGVRSERVGRFNALRHIGLKEVKEG